MSSISEFWQGVGRTVYAISALLLLVFLVTNLSVSADSLSYSVTASVLPTIIVVVNDNNEIQKIISNTRYSTRPTVLLNSLNGPPVSYNSKIQQEYKTITNNGTTLKLGVDYSLVNHSSNRSHTAYVILAFISLMY